MSPEENETYLSERREYEKLHRDHTREREKIYRAKPEVKAHRKKMRQERFQRIKDLPETLAYKRKASLKRTRSLKQQAISAYGERCVCCGENEFEFLSIDHKTPEAKKRDISRWKSHGTAGAGLYAHLRKEGWPKEDYQLLCMNCNFAKGKYGICPHQFSLAQRFNLSTEDILKI